MNLFKLKTGKIILISAITLMSCERKISPAKENIIPLATEVGKYGILNLSDYVTDLKYIPLETNDSVLISNIEQIIYENEKIIITSDWRQNECLVFNKNGAFCNKIGNIGQGPEEYIALQQIFTHDNLIYIKTPSVLLKTYDTDGNFVKKIPLPDLKSEYMIREVQPITSDIFFLDIASHELSYYPITILIKSNGITSDIIKEYTEPFILEKPFEYVSNNEFAITYRFKNEIRYYKYTNCDTIFTIGKSLNKKDAFIFDFGKYKPTRTHLTGKKDNSLSGAPPIRPIKILESSDFLFIEFNFAKYAPEPFEFKTTMGSSTKEKIVTNSMVFGLFDKNTKTLNLMNQPIKRKLGLKNDIDGGPVIWPLYISTNDELVTSVSSDDFLEYFDQIENPTPELVHIAKQVKSDDNPIIVIAKLKDKHN